MITELTTLAEASFKKLSTSGELQKLVDDQVTRIVKESLSNAMGYSSPFKKALEEYVTHALPLDFSGLGLGGYSAEIIKVIKLKLDASLMQWVDKTIAETMGELLSPPPESIQLSELIRQIRHFHRSSYSSQEHLSIDIKDSTSSDGYWSLEAQMGYSGYRLAVNKTGEIYSVSIPYQGDVSKRLFATCKHSDFETSIWRLYAGKTKLIRDVSSPHDVDDDDSDGE